MTWKCAICEKTFEEPKVEKEDPGEKDCSLPKGYYYYDVCPSCGDEDIFEVVECNHPKCGEWIPYDEILCEKHQIELDKEFSALLRDINSRYFEDNDKAVEWLEDWLDW